MRAIVQRITSGSVEVDGVVIAKCGSGLLLLVGVHKEDTEGDARKLADKVVGLRIFNDDAGKLNMSLLDQGIDATALAVSNFTVYGDAAKGRRPNFMSSAGFDAGRALFNLFVEELTRLGASVQTGEYGADMKVSLVNDGPVTLIVETR